MRKKGNADRPFTPSTPFPLIRGPMYLKILDYISDFYLLKRTFVHGIIFVVFMDAVMANISHSKR
jgi:hypothetical protein